MCLLAFSGCSSSGNKQSTAPQTTEEPYPEANPASDFEYSVAKSDKNAIVITKYIGEAKDVVIPQKIDNTPVVSIYYAAFFKSDITSVVMPDSVKYVLDYAFELCKNLTRVEFGKNTIYIGMDAFRGCSALSEAVLPPRLERIEAEAFYECTSLKSIFIPKTIKKIKDEAFSGCSSVTELNIEDGVTDLMGYAIFAGCKSLKEVTIPSSVVSFSGTSVFGACPALEKIIFLGNAPTFVSGRDPLGPLNNNVKIYYDSKTKGWDTTSLKDYYTLVEMD